MYSKSTQTAYRQTFGTSLVKYKVGSDMDQLLTTKQRQELKQGDQYYGQTGIISTKHYGQIKFDMYIRARQESKGPQFIVALNNKEFKHILVKLGTGRLFIPIERKSNENPIQFKYMTQRVDTYITMDLPYTFEEMKSRELYPVNLSLWNDHVTKYGKIK